MEKVKDMTSSRSESALIAEQLRRAFDGDAWHGPALLELLQDVDAATAAAKPSPDAIASGSLFFTLPSGMPRLAAG
jgi:hypothetical protein